MSKRSTAHTPGPWKMSKPRKGWGGHYDFQIHWSDEGECVAEIVHSEADARLIAAAPELLAHAKTLAAALRHYISIDKKNGDDEGATLKSITLALVEDTIAKAEGRANA